MRDSRRGWGRAVGWTVLVAGPLALLGGMGIAQQPPGRGPGGPPPPLKNVKLLKGMSHDQLISVMHDWSTSLGQRCDFCHVVNPDHSGFELDTKPQKNVARKMLTMVKNLNA